MIFNQSNLKNILSTFDLKGAILDSGLLRGGKGGATLDSFFEGGTFNRETFDKAEMDPSINKASLGDALEFGFGKNAKNYTDEALINAGEAYSRTGQVGLGTFATPTHSSSLLMETMDKSVVASAFGGAAIGGITGAAMGNDSGESAVYGGVAGAAMFGMGRGLRSGAFMEQIEKRAISSVLGKSHDELSKAKTDVYNSELKEIDKKIEYDENRPSTARNLNAQSIAEENALDPNSLDDAEKHIRDHEKLYGNATRQDALKRIDQIEEELYIDENGVYTNDKKAIEEEVARKAAAREDVSPYFNQDGSLKTGRQQNEEAYAAAKKDYEDNSYYHERHLVTDQEMRDVFDNEVVPEINAKEDEIWQRKRNEALKDDKVYHAEVAKENDAFKAHMKKINDPTNLVKNHSGIEQDMDSYISGGKNDFTGSAYQKEYQEIQKIRNSKDPKDVKNKEKLLNNVSRKMEAAKSGTYDNGRGQQINYSDLDDLKKNRADELETHKQDSFENSSLYNQKWQEYSDEYDAMRNKLDTDENVFSHAKAKKIEEEKKLFDEHKKQASEARTKENNILQEEIDKNTILYNEANRLTGDPSTFDINERIKAKGYDKVDDDLFYNNLNPGKENDPLDVKKKFNKQYKEQEAENELRTERAQEYYIRTQPGEDLESMAQVKSLDRFKFDNIEAYKEKQKINNEIFDENYGTFVNSFEKNKQATLRIPSENLENIIKRKEKLKTDKNTEKNIINQNFDKLEKSQELVDKYKNPKNFSNLNEILTNNGKQTAPAKPFSTIDEYADPKQPGVSNTTEAFNNAPSTIYGYRLMPNEYSARENMLKDNRGKLPSLANKELLQEAVAAKPSSFMGKQAQKLLRSGPDHNVGMQTRHMVLGGSMLAGAAFGSKRKDHSRGFNSHRGNRI